MKKSPIAWIAFIVLGSVILFFASCSKDQQKPTPEPPQEVSVSWIAISNPVDYTRGGFEFAGRVSIAKPITADAFITLQWDNFDTDKKVFIATGLSYKFTIPANGLTNDPYTQTGIKALIGSLAVNVKIISATTTGNYKLNF